MSTETVLKVAGLTINVVRKDIKNLHLGVYPPAGRIRVAAPLVISDEEMALGISAIVVALKAFAATPVRRPSAAT